MTLNFRMLPQRCFLCFVPLPLEVEQASKQARQKKLFSTLGLRRRRRHHHHFYCALCAKIKLEFSFCHFHYSITTTWTRNFFSLSTYILLSFIALINVFIFWQWKLIEEKNGKYKIFSTERECFLFLDYFSAFIGKFSRF